MTCVANTFFPFLLSGKHRDLQRVTVPYAKLLGVVDNESEDDDAMET
jgi:protein HIRA/HIR1